MGYNWEGDENEIAQKDNGCDDEFKGYDVHGRKRVEDDNYTT